MGFSLLNESFNFISFSYWKNKIRVIIMECGLFRGLLINSFICTLAPLTEYKCIQHWRLIMMLGRLRSVTVKCDICVMRILCESRYAFAIKCWFNSLLFHIHLEPFSFTSMRRLIHLTLLLPLIPNWLRNCYMVSATKPLAPISPGDVLVE